MVCDELNICHDLVLYQKVIDNAYSTPLHHEALDVEHQMVILGIVLYHDVFLLLFVQHQYYPEHDTLCLSVFLYWLLFCIYPYQ